MDSSDLQPRTRMKAISQHPKLKSIKIPKSTENAFIIPCNLSGYGFMLLDESREVVKDIPTPTLNKTITTINKLIDNLLIKKKNIESMEFNTFNVLTLQLLLGSLLITAFVMYLLVLYEIENFKENNIYVTISIMLAIVVASLVFLARALMVKREFFDADSEISKALDKQIDKENLNFYQQKGYMLEKGSKFAWLAIKKVF